MSVTEQANRSLRILYVIPGSENSSDQIFSKRLAASVRSAGTCLDIFYLPIWSSVSSSFVEIRRLRQTIRRTEPDLIHAQFGTMTAALCAFFTTKKLMVTFRGTDLNPCSGMGRARLFLGHLLSQLSALRAAKIICVSRELKGRLWWARDRVEVIPSPIDLDIFRPLSKEDARATFGWDAKARVVLFNLGNDPIGKGLHIAEEAVKIAESRLGPIRLVILSGGIPGDEMPLYLNGADCLLVASDWEGSPNIVKEAIACSLPVVSSRVGDVEERLQGIFPSKVTERDPRRLGEALADILALDQRSNESETILQLSQDRITQRFLSIYQEILSGDHSTSVTPT